MLYFGRFSKEKGTETLLQAVKELPQIPFVFAGNGPFEDEVNQVANIENKGFLNGVELSNVIANAAFSLITSECYENCPFSVMESQILHTPVIGADIGGIPELIHEGIDGELFESGNMDQLKDRIRMLWSDNELIKSYSKNCEQIHYDSIEEYTLKLLEIYL